MQKSHPKMVNTRDIAGNTEEEEEEKEISGLTCASNVSSLLKLTVNTTAQLRDDPGHHVFGSARVLLSGRQALNVLKIQHARGMSLSDEQDENIQTLYVYYA